MKVVRIEHPNTGEGFFRSVDKRGFNHSNRHSQEYEILERHTKENGFPGFYFDDELHHKFVRSGNKIWDYNFAYHSLEQLKKGFTENDIKECIALGFRILMYTLSKDYYSSKYQVVFLKKSADSVEDISSLFM